MVSKITYQKTTVKRLCFGSVIAAILYCLVVIIPFLRAINIVCYLILLPLIPIKIIFNPKRIKKWVQTFIISNITALVIGGMSYGVCYWVQEQKIVSNSAKRMYGKFSIWMLIFSILGSYIMIQICRYYAQKRNIDMQKLYQVKILCNGEKIGFEALLDTGNKVYDPLTKCPVIIVEHIVLKQLLPEAINKIYAKKEDDITCIIQEASKYEFGARVRIIPYYSLGNPNGLLVGFKADSVWIVGNDLEEKCIENVIIAIYQYNLSGEDTYHGLLHGDLVS